MILLFSTCVFYSYVPSVDMKSSRKCMNQASVYTPPPLPVQQQQQQQSQQQQQPRMLLHVTSHYNPYLSLLRFQVTLALLQVLIPTTAEGSSSQRRQIPTSLSPSQLRTLTSPLPMPNSVNLVHQTTKIRRKKKRRIIHKKVSSIRSPLDLYHLLRRDHVEVDEGGRGEVLADEEEEVDGEGRKKGRGMWQRLENLAVWDC